MSTGNKTPPIHIIHTTCLFLDHPMYLVCITINSGGRVGQRRQSRGGRRGRRIEHRRLLLLRQGQGGWRQGQRRRKGGGGRRGTGRADRQAGQVEAEGGARGDGGRSKGRGPEHDEGITSYTWCHTTFPFGRLATALPQGFARDMKRLNGVTGSG